MSVYFAFVLDAQRSVVPGDVVCERECVAAPCRTVRDVSVEELAPQGGEIDLACDLLGLREYEDPSRECGARVAISADGLRIDQLGERTRLGEVLAGGDVDSERISELGSQRLIERTVQRRRCVGDGEQVEIAGVEGFRPADRPHHDEALVLEVVAMGLDNTSREIDASRALRFRLL
ncbi:MAG: hypothetical protein R3B99_03205 [Polyangiales bacterium]